MNDIYKKEINKLDDLLHNANIPHEMKNIHDGFQIWYPSFEEQISDVVCHSFSYGHQEGLLEQMGLLGSASLEADVEGWLTAEQVFQRWSKHWKRNHWKPKFSTLRP